MEIRVDFTLIKEEAWKLKFLVASGVKVRACGFWVFFIISCEEAPSSLVWIYMSGGRTAYEQKKQNWRWKRREEKKVEIRQTKTSWQENEGEETEYKIKKLKEIEEYIEAEWEEYVRESKEAKGGRRRRKMLIQV